MDYSRNVEILTWQSFLVGFSLWAPIAILYFSKVSGSYTLGLSIFSIAMVSSALFEIPTGIFSDLIGRKYATILGSFFYFLAFILYAIGLNYSYLVIGALMEGLARSFHNGNNDALLYDSLNKSDQKEALGKWMGYIGSAEQWALGIAALLGGILAARYSFKLVVWLSAIPMFLYFVMSWWLVETKKKHIRKENIYSHLKESMTNFLRNEKLRLLNLSDVIAFGLSESAFQFRSVFVASLWPLWAIGMVQMLSNIGAAVGFGLSGKILKKIKAISILVLGSTFSEVINLTALIFPTVASPALMTTTSIWYGPSVVAKNTLMQKEFSDKQRATMGSLNSLARNLFFGVAATMTGLIADKFGPRTALIVSQLLGIVTIWLGWKLYKLIRDEKQT